MTLVRWAAMGCLVCSVQAKVVINEISYHPPDDNDALEFIELFNSGEQAVDLRGWKFTKGIKFEFTNKTEIAAKGFVVLARDGSAFKEVYGAEATGVFSSSLKDSGENLELSDAQGKRVERVNFKDDAPWPLSADGESATLERISPGAESEAAANWASSPLSNDPGKPAGTPGKQNANYAAVLPPVISGVVFEPKQPSPAQSVKVSGVVRDAADLQSVELVYRVAMGGVQKPEERITLPVGIKSGGGLDFTASIPAQPENAIVRFRIEAVNRSGSRRLEPGANEPLPAYSYFVHEKFEAAKIARGFILHLDEADFKRAQKSQPARSGPPGMSQADQERFMARMNFENATDFSSLWSDLCLTQQLSHAQLTKVGQTAREELAEAQNGIDKLEESEEPMKDSQELVAAFQGRIQDKLGTALNEPQRAALKAWQESKKQTAGRPPMQTPEAVLKRLCPVEGAFLYVGTRPALSEAAFTELKTFYARRSEEREKLVPAIRDVMQGKGDQGAALERMQALNSEVDKEFGGLLADDAMRKGFEDWRENTNPFRMRPPGGSAKESEPGRGKNAFVYVPAEGGAAELYDFVEVKPRNGGYKVHFAKRQALRAMTTINLIFEYNDRFVLAEPLAYEVYRRAGNAAAKTEFVRLHLDGRPFGYHVLVEQPNRAFLKRNKIRDDGDLFKILWYEQGAVRQHEKKTNERTGHDGLLAVLEALDKTSGDEEWAVIKKHFNVEQVINYFAVNMVLSHWDGYFNNYFAYHDVAGTGKWEMYPWDQDKTWGFHDRLGETVFFDMPVTFGMEGDVPPGHPKNQPPPKGFNGGNWWRGGGVFSKPLLANAEFRKVFLARTKEILENVYTEKEFFPMIDKLNEQLGEEVRLRAELIKEDPAEALARFEQNRDSLKEHLGKRREFLLAQEEIKNAGKFERAGLR